MYRAYAHDPVMRINLGIRRRLAPLLHNNRQKMELMHGLLCSLPGTPVLYYGDEIGMGDNVYLGDRDGVRTPMQWSADRNAGFSDREPAEAVHAGDHRSGVQLRDRQRRRPARQPRVVAVVGAPADRAAQALPGVRARLDRAARRPTTTACSRSCGATEAAGRRDAAAGARRREPVAASAVRRARPVRVPRHAARRAVRPDHVPADRRPALPADARAARVLLARARHSPADGADREQPVLPSLVAPARGTRSSIATTGNGSTRCCPRLLRSRRWFGAKGRRVTRGAHRRRRRAAAAVPLERATRSCDAPRPARIAFVEVEYLDGEPETYVLPIAFVPGAAGERFIEDHPGAALTLVEPTTGEAGVLVDAHWLPGYGRAVMSTLARRRRHPHRARFDRRRAERPALRALAAAATRTSRSTCCAASSRTRRSRSTSSSS